MAATVTVPQLVGSAIQMPEGDAFPWQLTTKWHATLLADGSPADLSVTSNIVDASFGAQADWDTVFDDALASYATVFSNTPTIGPSNPINI